MPNSGGFLGTQRPATQIEVLQGFRDLLRAELSEWDAESIYWTDTANPDTAHNLTRFIQIHAGGGTYGQGEIIGAGPNVIIENSMIGVTYWHRSEGDSSGKSELSMMMPEDGLIVIKRRILKALAGQMIYDQTTGALLTVAAMSPQSAIEPHPGDVDQPLDSVGLFFSVDFQWDLS